MLNPNDYDKEINSNYTRAAAKSTDPNIRAQAGYTMVYEPIYRFALREDLQDRKEFLPTRVEPKSSGWDVRAAVKENIVLAPFQKILIPLGFRAFPPNGWWFELKPRSSTFAKKHLHCLYGTIDESYEGELLLACQYIPIIKISPNGPYHYIIDNIEPLTINAGDAVGQIIPVKRQEMVIQEVSNEEFAELCQERNGQRGAGGFGSSDGQK